MAVRLASSMMKSTASQVAQQDGAVYTSQACAAHPVVELIHATQYDGARAAHRCHFRHEGKTSERAMDVQRGHDLIERTHLDLVAGPQVQTIHRADACSA
jgi:hypothetical protein